MDKFICKLTLLFLYTILFSACYDFEPAFPPQFKVSNHLIYLDIQKLIKTKGIYIEGHKTRIDDSLDISLTVQLINAKGLSKDKDSVMYIQKEVARKVKSQLKNPLQFKAYDIIFIQRDTVKENMGTMTTEIGLANHRFYNSEL